MKKTNPNKGTLKNPAVIAAASSPAGQSVLRQNSEVATAAAKEGLSIVSLIVKTALVFGAGWFILNKFKKSFEKVGHNPNLPPANISDGQASAKANAMYQAMVGFGADKEIVATQLAGLNYNGWVKVYNAFGNRKGSNPLGDAMNLVEWLNDQFDAEDLADLRFVLNGVFRTSQPMYVPGEINEIVRVFLPKLYAA